MMTVEKSYQSSDTWFGETVTPGDSRDLTLFVSESYSGAPVEIPIHVRRAKEAGPTLFITAALHGNEINGTGAVRQIIRDESLFLQRGTLVLVPVLNLLGFERHSRYLPDRRDLNRSFPGSSKGSLASRLAQIIFTEIIKKCDYGIDLHTAAVHRTNYPNVRGDFKDPQVKQLAEAFGCEIMINSKGPKGSLRREACRAGIPTIIMEGGETLKVEPGIVESCVRGIKNVLVHFKMIDAEPEHSDYQIAVNQSKWIRAEQGGFLQFHIQPGEMLEKGQAIATNTTILGEERNTFYAPFNAVVIGMTSLPAISPGDPICNLGKLPMRYKPSIIEKMRSEEDGLEQQVLEELASNVLVVDP